MTNTVWSAIDKTNVTNTTSLTATATGAGGLRAADKQNSGKYYWEVTANSWSGNTWLGIGRRHTGFSNGAVQSSYVTISGAIFLNGVSVIAPGLAARANGDVIGIALDLDNRYVWYRVAPSGLWNGNAAHNPATLAAGVGSNIASVGGGALDVYPMLFFAASGHNMTANFGDTAFVGTPPSGYTPGFPTGIGGIPNYMLASQVALEMWTSTALYVPPPAAGGGPRITMIG